ncbi:MAG: hypothetical protein ACRDMX_16240, partial [Solirubrobacteraceae bacterium]
SHVFAACDRVNLIQDGVIALDKTTTDTSADELNEIVVEEYRRARMARAGNGGTGAAGGGADATGEGAGAAPEPDAPAQGEAGADR